MSRSLGGRTSRCYKWSGRAWTFCPSELLDEIVATGVAVSAEDVVLGVATVAAPIFDHRGKVRAALAFNLPPEMLRRERALYVELARAAGEEASRAFGHDPTRDLEHRP